MKCQIKKAIDRNKTIMMQNKILIKLKIRYLNGYKLLKKLVMTEKYKIQNNFKVELFFIN